MKNNRVNQVLDAASRTVRAWPEWMQRPEVRSVAAPRAVEEEAVDEDVCLDEINECIEQHQRECAVADSTRRAQLFEEIDRLKSKAAALIDEQTEATLRPIRDARLAAEANARRLLGMDELEARLERLERAMGQMRHISSLKEEELKYYMAIPISLRRDLLAP